MENILRILSVIIMAKYLLSITCIFKNLRGIKYVVEIALEFAIFILTYKQTGNLYFSLCVAETEFLISNLCILINVIVIKNISFRLLVSVTHDGIGSKILCKIFGKKRFCQTIRELQSVNYGPRLKHGIPAMAGKKHKKTGIRYNRWGFPIFESYYTMSLPSKYYSKSREFHFSYANKKLYKRGIKSKTIRRLFTKNELNELKRGNTPSKYTWHHHQNKGKMQLVSSKIHSQVHHIGGYDIWGGN